MKCGRAWLIWNEWTDVIAELAKWRAEANGVYRRGKNTIKW